MLQPIQRSGLPMLFLAAIVLAAAIGLVLLFATPLPDSFLRFLGRSDAVSEPPAEPQAERPVEAVEDVEPPTVADIPEPEPEPEPVREISASQIAHRVIKGDTLFDLAGRYWSDPYLWPLLLVANAEGVDDPDFLRQGSTLSIPSAPDPAAVRSGESTLQAIVDAHVEAYRRYRRLGDDSLARGRANGSLWLVQRGLMRINKAHWVLYSGLRYDEDLLDKTAGAVSEEDLRIVRAYIARFGPRPGYGGSTSH